MEYLNEYQQLPSFLLDAVNEASRASNGMQRSGCIGDVTAEDCNQDNACTSDCNDSPCYGDTTDPDCTSDSGCTSDVTPCGRDSICQDTVCHTDGGCSDTCSDSPPVVKRRASISVSNITRNSCLVTVTKNDASTIHVVVREDSGGQATVLDTGNISISQSSRSYSLTGLSPSTTYVYNLWDDIGGWIGTDTFVTDANPRPDDWQWWSTVRNGAPINLSANEWNAFCERINEFRVYCGLPEYGAFIRVYSGNEISAKIVNHAAWAIEAMTSTAPDGVIAGDTITANFFNGLKNALNSIT